MLPHQSLMNANTVLEHPDWLLVSNSAYSLAFLNMDPLFFLPFPDLTDPSN